MTVKKEKLLNQERLLTEWENNRKKISTEKLQTNIWQLKDWYTWKKRMDGTWEETPTLIINPSFQRLYRWNREQKSHLIESVLLWIPIPPIFVSENLEWKYEVIDWLQRISTILEFLWVLEGEVKKEKSIKKWLVEPSYLWSLDWMLYKDLPETLQKRFLNTYRVDLNILKSESDTSVKYELFNRLNSLWTPLTEQEIRNTLLLQFRKEVYFKLKELAWNENFKEVVNITEGKIEVEKDTEMVLRFFALIDYDDKKSKIKSVSTFIDNKMKELISFNSIDANIFINVFKILNWIEGWNILKRYKNWVFRWPVMIPWFDLIVWWLWFAIKNNNFNLTDFSKKDILNRIKFIWENKTFNRHIENWNFIEHKLEVCLDIWRKLFNLSLSLSEIEDYIENNWK